MYSIEKAEYASNGGPDFFSRWQTPAPLAKKAAPAPVSIKSTGPTVKPSAHRQESVDEKGCRSPWVPGTVNERAYG